MKIKKNGKVINLTESDLSRIVKKVIKEQDESPAKELEEYNVAVVFCGAIEKWWKGSGNWFFNPDDMYGNDTEYVKFFKPFNDDSDNDAAAAQAYEHMVLNKLDSKVDVDNQHYQKIKNWIMEIVKEIGEWKQSSCNINIYGPNGKSEYFTVDPEIDV